MCPKGDEKWTHATPIFTLEKPLGLSELPHMKHIPRRRPSVPGTSDEFHEKVRLHVESCDPLVVFVCVC